MISGFWNLNVDLKHFIYLTCSLGSRSEPSVNPLGSLDSEFDGVRSLTTIEMWYTN